MEDQDDFTFDPEDEDSTAEEPLAEEAPPASAQPEPRRRGGFPSRVLLLILLLVVAVGAGAYYLARQGVSRPLPTTPPVAVKRPIRPVPPAAPAVQHKGESSAAARSAPAASPVASVAFPVVPVASASPPAASAVQHKGGRPAPAKSAPVLPGKEGGRPASAAAKKAGNSLSVATKGNRYTLQAGAFLFKSNLQVAVRAVRRLGFTPRVRTIHKKVPMIRLRLGAYDPPAARDKLAALKKLTPDAFLLPAGRRLGVFAGSYFERREAQRYEKLLAAGGFPVTEDPVKLAMPLSRLRFGLFADRESAVKAAARARAAGLDAELVRRPGRVAANHAKAR